MHAICLLGLVINLGAGQAADQPAGKEPARFQGTWYLSSVQLKGEQAAWMDLANVSKLAVKGDHVQFKSRRIALGYLGRTRSDKPERPVLEKICSDRKFIEVTKQTVSLRLTIDGDKQPGHIDIDEEKGTIQGLYAQDGNKLKICVPDPSTLPNAPKESDEGVSIWLAPRGMKRPKQVALRPQSMADSDAIHVAVVRKQEWQAQKLAWQKAMKADLERLAGTWEVVEGRYDGKELAPKDLEGFQLVFADDQVSWQEAGKTHTLKVETDPTTSLYNVTAINLVRTEQAGKSLFVPGIYRLEGDQLFLRLRWNHQLERPASFAFVDDGQLPALPGICYYTGGDAKLVLKKSAK
ncbi:MAG: TIGR03067 domain-containing protein [Gemmataceae bacterium]